MSISELKMLLGLKTKMIKSRDACIARLKDMNRTRLKRLSAKLTAANKKIAAQDTSISEYRFRSKNWTIERNRIKKQLNKQQKVAESPRALIDFSSMKYERDYEIKSLRALNKALQSKLNTKESVIKNLRSQIRSYGELSL